MRNVIEIDIIEPAPEIPEDRMVIISAKIVSFLNDSLKRHNKDNPTRKVLLSQLKSVFKSGAIAAEGMVIKYTKIQAGIARVNSFLEMVAGKPIDLVYKRKNKELITNLFDYFEDVNFSDSEMAFASEQALAFNITSDEDFDSVESLYLDCEKDKQTWFEI